jgi:hypothetical protein
MPGLSRIIFDLAALAITRNRCGVGHVMAGIMFGPRRLAQY